MTENNYNQRGFTDPLVFCEHCGKTLTDMETFVCTGCLPYVSDVCMSIIEYMEQELPLPIDIDTIPKADREELIHSRVAAKDIFERVYTCPDCDPCDIIEGYVFDMMFAEQKCLNNDDCCNMFHYYVVTGNNIYENIKNIFYV